MRWSIQLTRQAVKELYSLDRELVPNIWAALRELIEDPGAANFQPSKEDPSLYWIAVQGDVAIFFEIVDEKQTVIVVRFE